MDIKEIASALKPIKVSPYNLYLDPYNPRFFGRDFKFAENVNPLDPKIQERIRKYIEDNFESKELLDSIGEVGFLPMDRMVAYNFDEDNYIVIEGNRRLAAIKTLIAMEDKKEIQIPDHVRKTIDQLEILYLELINDNKKEATWFLQGIRHISGIKDWGPYQQAQLVHSLMVEHEMSFTEAGKAIGVGKRKAAQMLRAFKGLRQMESDPVYGGKASPELFSHFEQAYVKAPLREWLEWDEESYEYKNKNALQLFYRWIVEDNSDTGQIKLKAIEVRDKLPLIISNEESRDIFIQDKENLDTAYGIALFAKGGYKNWHYSITNAIDHIKRIPWTYEITEQDEKLLLDLMKNIDNFLKKNTKSDPTTCSN